MKDNPSVIIHMPDYYDGSNEKWKDRFMTTAATMSLGMIRYLNWPGDRHRFSHQTHTKLGQFGVYRYDEEATRRLREELEKLDPKTRWDSASTTSRLGQPKVDKAFNSRLTAIFKRLGAD